MSSIRYIIPSMVLAVGIAAAGISISEGFFKLKTDNRYVTVKGLAEKVVTANQAIWQFNFKNANDDMKALYKDIADAKKQVELFLAKQGIATSDIQYRPIQVTDNDMNSYVGNKKVKRYSASNTVVVNTANIAQIEQALQNTSELISSGIVISQSNIRYLYNDLNTIKPDMLNLATAKAKDAANVFAKDSDSKLGGIRHASQGQFSIRNADGSYGDNNPEKKVRVVTTVQYYLG